MELNFFNKVAPEPTCKHEGSWKKIKKWQKRLKQKRKKEVDGEE